MSEHEELIDRIAEALRAPATASPGAKQRLMAGIRDQGRRGRLRAAWSWVVHPRPVMVSPLLGGALAAGIAALLWLRPVPETAGEAPSRGDARVPTVPRAGAALSGRAESGQAVQFVLVLPRASQVSLVGDFNDWDPAATPLRQSSEGVWSVVATLPPGRHLYAFVVDGARWIADPEAPRAPDDDFGAPNSVRLVGGQPT